MKNLLIISLIFVSSIFTVSAQTRVAAKNATNYTGRKVTICDKVYGQDNKAYAVTFFLGADRPNQLLSVVIRFSNRINTKGYFDNSFKGKDICITGVVQNSKDGPYIKVNDPKQIREMLLDNPVKSTQGF